MAYEITVVLTTGSRSFFYSEDTPMFTDDEGVLVIDTLQGATIHYNARNVLAWVTTPMDEDRKHAVLQAIEDMKNGVVPEAREGGLEDGSDGGVPA